MLYNTAITGQLQKLFWKEHSRKQARVTTLTMMGKFYFNGHLFLDCIYYK